MKILGCAIEDLIVTEQFYIDCKKCWFNISSKAGTVLGIKRSDDFKEKSRKATLGRKHSEESRKQRSIDSKGEKNHFFGKHHSEETNQKRREWNLLHPPTKEAREKQRQSLIRFYERKRFEIININ